MHVHIACRPVVLVYVFLNEWFLASFFHGSHCCIFLKQGEGGENFIYIYSSLPEALPLKYFCCKAHEKADLCNNENLLFRCACKIEKVKELGT